MSQLGLNNRLRMSVVAVASLCMCFVLGCEQPPAVTTQERPRTATPRVPLDVARFRAELDHVLAAIVPHGEEAWFFKLTAPAAEIDSLRKPFEEFLASVEFNDGSKPQWEAPEGWTEGPGDAVAAATFRIPIGGGLSEGTDLQMTVTRLPMSGEQKQYVTENVNRWLRQLQQSPLDQAAVQSLTKELPTKDGKAIFVELAGVISKGPASMHPPIAASEKSAVEKSVDAEQTPNQVPKQTKMATPAEFTYQAPAGWQPGPMNSMRKAAFSLTGGEDQAAEVTVTVFPATSGMSDPLGNAQRWAGMIGLKNTDEEIKESLEPRKISGLEGTYLELIGEDLPEAILVLMVTRDSQIWFFRMKGDRELVESQRHAFGEFLDSVEFRK